MTRVVLGAMLLSAGALGLSAAFLPAASTASANVPTTVPTAPAATLPLPTTTVLPPLSDVPDLAPSLGPTVTDFAPAPLPPITDLPTTTVPGVLPVPATTTVPKPAARPNPSSGAKSPPSQSAAAPANEPTRSSEETVAGGRKLQETSVDGGAGLYRRESSSPRAARKKSAAHARRGAVRAQSSDGRRADTRVSAARPQRAVLEAAGPASAPTQPGYQRAGVVERVIDYAGGVVAGQFPLLGFVLIAVAVVLTALALTPAGVVAYTPLRPDVAARAREPLAVGAIVTFVAVGIAIVLTGPWRL